MSNWDERCKDELGLTSPVDPDGNHCESYEVAYWFWQRSFSRYDWTLVSRAALCWAGLKVWLANNFPEALGTLRRGVTEQDLNAAEYRLGLPIPEAARILYRLCDGQDIDNARLFGLIGGYFVHRQHVNVHLLPLESVTSEGNNIIVAQSFPPHSPKTFLIHSRSGQLCVKMSDRVAYPCVQGNQGRDSMLSWLEFHLHCLEQGRRIIRQRPNGSRAISLFPEGPNETTITTTHHVQVRVSAVYMPECSVNDGPYEFGYLVRMRLLETSDFSSVQLKSRKWDRYQEGKFLNTIHGEGVRGQNPTLERGGEEIVYDSRTSLPTSPSGLLDGTFFFFTGSLADPEGKELEVEVGPIYLYQPECIY